MLYFCLSVRQFVYLAMCMGEIDCECNTLLYIHQSIYMFMCISVHICTYLYHIPEYLCLSTKIVNFFYNLFMVEWYELKVREWVYVCVCTYVCLTCKINNKMYRNLYYFLNATIYATHTYTDSSSGSSNGRE